MTNPPNYVQINSDYTGYDNKGVLNYFNSVYDDVNNINNDNLINEKNAKYNVYNYKKNKMYINVLYVVIITCIIVLILTFIRKQNNYFDSNAYLIIVSISLGIAACYILYLLKDILFRDKMDFDEYDFSRYGTGSPLDTSANNVWDNTTIDISGTKCKTKTGTISSFFK
jgi:hypothetical protein